MKFYQCSHCGNIIYKVKDSKVAVHCCGEVMQELTANTVEAAVEKHIPVLNGNKVEVGSIPHPMTEEHFIEWIAVEYENAFSIFYLSSEDDPSIELTSTTGIKSIYAYCNLHGLWKMNE